MSKECSAIKSINLGGAKKKPGYRQISQAIYIGEEEEKAIREMIDRGLEVEIRQLAADSKVLAKAVL